LKNERRRLQGCEEALESAGLPHDGDLVWEGNLRPEHVAAACSERLRRKGARPDAMLSTNGPTGLGVLRALRDCGLTTPEDIAFATFDELTVADLFTPSITTIEQPAYDIGFRAAEVLLDRIDDESDRKASVRVRLPAVLHVRASSSGRRLLHTA
jgi:DNA-binding LacI/PurR family transcriptional regulator